MQQTRVIIVTAGLLLPYASRIPGVLLYGPQWFLSFLGSGSGLGAFVFIGLFNAICWGSVIVSTLGYRHPRSALFPVVLGFSLPGGTAGAVRAEVSTGEYIKYLGGHATKPAERITQLERLINSGELSGSDQMIAGHITSDLKNSLGRQRQCDLS